jgi:hypothetical protein
MNLARSFGVEAIAPALKRRLGWVSGTCFPIAAEVPIGKTFVKVANRFFIFIGFNVYHSKSLTCAA